MYTCIYCITVSYPLQTIVVITIIRILVSAIIGCFSFQLAIITETYNFTLKVLVN